MQLQKHCEHRVAIVITGKCGNDTQTFIYAMIVPNVRSPAPPPHVRPARPIWGCTVCTSMYFYL